MATEMTAVNMAVAAGTRMRTAYQMSGARGQGVRRDRLVQDHVYLVRDVLAYIGGCLPDGVDFGDLGGHGLAALLEAAESYAGPEGGFGEYARGRVTARVKTCVRGHAWYRGVCEVMADEDVCAAMAVDAREFLGGARPSLREAIGALPEDQRVVLGLYFQEELSLAEIAEAMDCSMDDVKEMFTRGGMMVARGV
jgi:RNA polymerase sigma factor (sigma-70 family)